MFLHRNHRSRTGAIGLAFLLTVAIGIFYRQAVTADDKEVILSFQAIDSATGESVEGTGFSIESQKYGTSLLFHGQHGTVEDGDALIITPEIPEGWAFSSWGGNITSGTAQLNQAFVLDALVQIQLVTSDSTDDTFHSVGSLGTNGGSQDSADGGGYLERSIGTRSISEVWVDFHHVGLEEGTETNPFDTLPEGVSTVLALSISPPEVNIEVGSTTNTMTIDDAITLIAPNGTVTIGAGGYTTTYTLSTSTIGTGSVTGDGNYLDGETATLDASASGGWAFSEWSGDLTGYADPDMLTMNSHKSVTATFVLNPASLGVTGANVNNGGNDPLPAGVEAGDTIDIEWFVTNGSNTADSADDDWTDNVYLSRDNLYDDEDKALGTAYTVTEAESYTGSTTITIPDASPGDYYLIVRTDTGDEVTHTASGRASSIYTHALTIHDSELTQ